MKLILFVLTATVTAFHHIHAERYQKEEILGGRFTHISKVPFQATVEYNGTLVCGATIIDKFWLITAVHNIINITDILSGQVRAGTSFTLSLGKVYKIKSITVHPGYEHDTHNNDIALIELETPIIFNENQQPVAISHSNDHIKVGYNVSVSGYDVENKGRRSTIIKVATLKVISNKKCKKLYRADALTKKMFCATSSLNFVTDGDYGGPAVIKGKVYGIITSRSNNSSPCIFTKISVYYKWIIQVTKLDI